MTFAGEAPPPGGHRVAKHGLQRGVEPLLLPGAVVRDVFAGARPVSLALSVTPQPPSRGCPGEHPGNFLHFLQNMGPPPRPTATLTGLEPAISTLTGWRGLQAPLQGHADAAFLRSTARIELTASGTGTPLILGNHPAAHAVRLCTPSGLNRGPTA